MAARFGRRVERGQERAPEGSWKQADAIPPLSERASGITPRPGDLIQATFIDRAAHPGLDRGLTPKRPARPRLPAAALAIAPHSMVGNSRAVRRGGTVPMPATTNCAPSPFRGQVVAMLDRPQLISPRSAMMRP